MASIAALAGCALPSTAWSGEPVFSMAAGAEYSTGEYGGTSPIDETYLPITLALDMNRVSLRVIVPYLSVRAPELTIVDVPDGQPIITEGSQQTESGVGDVIAMMTVYDVLLSADGSVAMDLTGKVKFGTADVDKGLGTGEHDYSVQADVFKFFSAVKLMGSVGYTLRGDPDYYDLDDSFYAYVGVGYAPSKKLSFGAFYDYRQASVEGTDAMQQLSGWIATTVGERGRAEFYVNAGFGDSTPDWGAGVSLSTSF
ncbi:MAG: hypothetical protein KA020_17160 [Planctomycetes bacterium]|nr:hypothetical protein [Planctomycetota bacterium]